MKHSVLLRLGLLLLVVLMVLGTVSCGDTKAPTSTTTAAPTTGEVDERMANDPHIPAQNWGEEKFTILYNGYPLEPNLDFIAEEANGSALNDAIYKRNMAIQEKHNLVIDPLYAKDKDFGSTLQKDQKSGECAICLVETCLSYTMPLALDGYYAEKSSLPSMNFDKPYWYKNLLEGSSIGGNNYFFYSDSCIHAFGATPCTIFNKYIHENLGYPDLYKMVKDGNWTFEEMSKLVKSTYAQSGENTTGKMDIKKDTIGLVANTFCIDCFLSGTGYQTFKKDENDMPVLDIFNDTFYNIVESISSLCAEENNMYLCDRYGSGEQIRDIDPKDAMEQNRALFWIGNFKCVERLRAMPTDFGVLPMPKANKDQQDYKVHMQVDVGASMAVPHYNEDAEYISAILEDIAYQSYLYVMPAYMDVLIQGQVIRDNASLDCVKIILKSYYCDLGYMLNRKGIDLIDQMHSIVMAGSSPSGALMKVKTKYEGNISKLKAEIAELN